MSICISVGHGKASDGAYDPGAVANGLYEQRIIKEIAKYTAKYYGENYEEKCDLINYDADMFLNDRIEYVNAGGYDFVAEIHLNAGGGTGPEVYYSVTSDNRIAKRISADIAKAFELRDRGAKTKTTSKGTDYFGIIRRTKMKAVLIECLFIDTPTDVELVKTASGQEKMGMIIAKAIAEERGVKEKKEEKKSEKTDSFYRVQTGAFKEKENAKNYAKKLENAGFDAFVTEKK